MALAATALGYGACWIGAFNEEEVKKIVKVPENLVVITLLPIVFQTKNRFQDLGRHLEKSSSRKRTASRWRFEVFVDFAIIIVSQFLSLYYRSVFS